MPFDLHDEARWGKDVYAWFRVGKVPGGTDAYFEHSAEGIRQFWEWELENPKYRDFEPVIRQAVGVGHRWRFRRSVSQMATTNLAYGLIAASLATLTDGFVHSIDSAWDWDRLPAFPQDFLRWYFRPELALTENFREWSARCIGHIEEELRS